MENFDHFDEVYSALKKELDVVKSTKNPQVISSCELRIHKMLLELQMVVPRFGNDTSKVCRSRRDELSRGE